MLKITKIDDNTFEVDILDSVETTHRVSVSDDYHRRLTSGQVSKEKLVEESFKFLLKRESNTSILSHFSLELIEDYFPEFLTEIRSRVQP